MEKLKDTLYYVVFSGNSLWNDMIAKHSCIMGNLRVLFIICNWLNYNNNYLIHPAPRLSTVFHLLKRLVFWAKSVVQYLKFKSHF